MKRIQGAVGAIVLAVAVFVPVAAQAHSATGKAFIKVNGQYAQENPVAKVSTETAEDLAPATYVVNRPIRFEVDQANFGQQAEFRWIWSEGQDGQADGAAASHSYAQPGTYKAVLQARFSPAVPFAEAGTVAVSVAPRTGYTAPTARVEVSPRTLVEGFEIGFRAKAGHDSSTKIASYEWEFGDGGKATGKNVEYTYKSRDFVASPHLKVTDANGLVAETTFDLRNRGTDVTVEDFEGLAGAATVARSSNTLIWGLLLLTAAAFAAVAGVVLGSRRKRSAPSSRKTGHKKKRTAAKP